MAKTIKEVMSKSKVSKMAHKGKDMGKKGKGFKKGVKEIEASGKSKESSEKIMGSQFWKMLRKGKL